MNKGDYAYAIRERVEKAKAGTLFAMVDFADLAPNNAANRVVGRLVEEGKLRVLLRGIYQKPKFSEFLQDFAAPNIDEIAQAIGRKNGWTIRPIGDTALNLLGLSTQVPASWIYVSDGPYKEYNYGEGKILFKHSSNRLLGNLSERSALFVQALRALGESHMNDECFIRLKDRFDAKECAKIELETRGAPDWIHRCAVKLKEVNYD